MDDNKRIFSEIIKRQIAILGPQITLTRVKNVPGIQVNENGDILSVTGDPQILLQELINQFVELSGLIVKKTMESILASHPNDMVIVGQAPVMQIAYGVSMGKSASSGAKSPSASNSNMTDANPGLATASRDLEDLNKMLNNRSSS